MAERFRDVQFLADAVAGARHYREDCAGIAFQEWMDHTVFQQNEFTPRFDSPLEAAFFAWWSAMIGEGWINRHIHLIEQQDVTIAGNHFRLDFVVGPLAPFQARLENHGLAWRPIAVELDGHTFHEKTRDQVTYRNQRDRLLQQADWRVFHISFDEMRTSPENAVGEVIGYSIQQFTALQSELYKREVGSEITCA